MADAFCPDCKRSTEVVFDHSAGDTVCSECGLVLEAHSIDVTSEWRTFANESADNDPVRVGGPTNPLLTDGGLSTVISKPNGAQADFLSSSLGRWQSRGANPDRNLILAFKTIATMADRSPLPLPSSIFPFIELLFSIERISLSLGMSDENKATKKEIGRAKEFIVKQLEVEMGQSMEMGTIHAGDFLMTRSLSKVLHSCFHVCRDSHVPCLNTFMLVDISLATGVAEGTIRNSYKDLYPYAPRIIPTSFAKEEDLKNLCSP
ncbi:hypothetical protein GW17_00029541 [Ensete ventricosum]|nr:hypothetical protein GW17_00029541 [Ensete ventricosum]RZR94943.1 hypothetical protein BHM03_00023711 [Ensete ventricosum]